MNTIRDAIRSGMFKDLIKIGQEIPESTNAGLKKEIDKLNLAINAIGKSLTGQKNSQTQISVSNNITQTSSTPSVITSANTSLSKEFVVPVNTLGQKIDDLNSTINGLTQAVYTLQNQVNNTNNIQYGESSQPLTIDTTSRPANQTSSNGLTNSVSNSSISRESYSSEENNIYNRNSGGFINKISNKAIGLVNKAKTATINKAKNIANNLIDKGVNAIASKNETAGKVIKYITGRSENKSEKTDNKKENKSVEKALEKNRNVKVTTSEEGRQREYQNEVIWQLKRLNNNLEKGKKKNLLDKAMDFINDKVEKTVNTIKDWTIDKTKKTAGAIKDWTLGKDKKTKRDSKKDKSKKPIKKRKQHSKKTVINVFDQVQDDYQDYDKIDEDYNNDVDYDRENKKKRNKKNKIRRNRKRLPIKIKRSSVSNATRNITLPTSTPISTSLALPESASTSGMSVNQTTKGAEATGSKAISKATGKSAGKSATKFGLKGATKLAGKTASKFVPGLGLVVGMADAADRFKSGDLLGAGISAVSGAVSTVPLVGGAISTGIDLLQGGWDWLKGDKDDNSQKQQEAEKQIGQDNKVNVGNIITEQDKKKNGVLNNLGSLASTAFKYSPLGLATHAIGSVGESVSNVVGGVAKGVGNVIGGVAQGAGNVVSGIAGGIGNAVGGIGRGVGNVVGGIGKGAWNVVSGVGNGVGSLVGGVGKGLWNVASGIGKGAWNVASGVGSGIENLAKTAFEYSPIGLAGKAIGSIWDYNNEKEKKPDSQQSVDTQSKLILEKQKRLKEKALASKLLGSNKIYPHGQHKYINDDGIVVDLSNPENPVFSEDKEGLIHRQQFAKEMQSSSVTETTKQYTKQEEQKEIPKSIEIPNNSNYSENKNYSTQFTGEAKSNPSISDVIIKPEKHKENLDNISSIPNIISDINNKNIVESINTLQRTIKKTSDNEINANWELSNSEIKKTEEKEESFTKRFIEKLKEMLDELFSFYWDRKTPKDALDKSKDTSNSNTGGGNNTSSNTDFSNAQAATDLKSGGDLGSYTSNEESGKEGSSCVSYDSTGGTSYGTYQFASKGKNDSFTPFLKWAEKNGGELGKKMASTMFAAGPLNTGSKSGQAVDAWKNFVASNDKNAIHQLEHTYMKQNHYDVALRTIAKTHPEAAKLIESDRGLQEALWSTSVQHGPGGVKSKAGAYAIFTKTYKQGITAKDWIKAIYQDRSGRFGSSTSDVQKSVGNRFKREVQVALGLSGQPTGQDGNAETGGEGNLSQGAGQAPTGETPINAANSSNSTSNTTPSVTDSTSSSAPATSSSSTGGNTENKQQGSSASGIASKYLSIARKNAQGASYSQDNRMGRKSYDCSSFVSRTLRETGFDVNPGNTTSTLRSDLERVGFRWHPGDFGSTSQLQAGDILLKVKDGESHTEFYSGDGKAIGAHGEKTGVSEKDFYSGHHYQGFLRLEGSGNIDPNIAKEEAARNNENQNSSTGESGGEGSYNTGDYQQTADSGSVGSGGGQQPAQQGLFGSVLGALGGGNPLAQMAGGLIDGFLGTGGNSGIGQAINGIGNVLSSNDPLNSLLGNVFGGNNTGITPLSTMYDNLFGRGKRGFNSIANSSDELMNFNPVQQSAGLSAGGGQKPEQVQNSVNLPKIPKAGDQSQQDEVEKTQQNKVSAQAKQATGQNTNTNNPVINQVTNNISSTGGGTSRMPRKTVIDDPTLIMLNTQLLS